MLQGKFLYLIFFSSYTNIFFFLALVLSGIGVPITDELVLVLAGYLWKKNFIFMIPVLILLSSGIVLGDLLSYSLGRIFGDRVYYLPLLRRYFNPHRQRRMDAFLRLYGRRT